MSRSAQALVQTSVNIVNVSVRPPVNIHVLCICIYKVGISITIYNQTRHNEAYGKIRPNLTLFFKNLIMYVYRPTVDYNRVLPRKTALNDN